MNIKRYVLPLAVFAVFALAGCGGGGTTTTEPEGPTAAEMAEMERQKADLAAKANALEMALAETLNTPAALQAANDAHMALTAAIAAATDVDTAMYQAQADAAMDTIAAAQKIADAKAEKERMDMAAAEAARMAAEQAAMNALAKALKAGISTDITRGQVESGHISEFRPVLANNELTLNPYPSVTGDAVASPAPNLKLKLDTATPVASLGAWNGAQYVRTDSDGMVTDTAVIYTNQGPPTRQPFAVKHADIINTEGRVPQTAAGFAALMPMSSAFRTTPGTKDHQLPASVTTRPEYISVRGTLDGAAGQFRCGTTAGTDVCTSAGGPDGTTILSAGWYFVADANAMTSTPDAAYSGFGWWLNEDGDNKRADGFWFVTRAGSAAAISDNNGSTSITEIGDQTAVQALKGTATYNGHAAGKVGFYDPVLSSRNVGGHFTADATLNVDFQDETAEGSGIQSWGTITGTIDNFMVDGHAADDWEVKLLTSLSAGSPAEANIMGPLDGGVQFTGRTSWSIDGETANADTGTFNGALLDKHEDSNLPLTAVGDFTARYGAVGSMTGGFGATTTDPDE